MGLTTAIGVLQGTNSPMFAISLVFSLIVSLAALSQVPAHPVALQSALRHAACLAALWLCAAAPSRAWRVAPYSSRTPTRPARHQVMYDASGVRLHAGKQASVLNMIITELPPDHPVSNSAGACPLRMGLGWWHGHLSMPGRIAPCCCRLGALRVRPSLLDLPPGLLPCLAGTLKDTLGHTPLQVAVGAVVGVLTGYLTALLYL